MRSRSDAGVRKYGVTLRQAKGDARVWLNHLQEELLDACNYVERLLEELDKPR